MLAVLAILPIFALIVLGYLLGWRQWLSAESAAGLASITFKLFMPLLLFPAMVWWLSGQLPGLNEAARSVLVLLAACPSGVNVLAFAKTPEDTRNVSSAVFLSTVLAALTLPLWMLSVL